MNPTAIMVVGACLLGLAVGVWEGRTHGEKKLLEYKQQQRKLADDAVKQVAKVEATDTATKKDSSTRLDTSEAEREKEVEYVDRKVIEYVVKYRDSVCPAPDAEWVCLYNRSLGLPCDVPQASATR